MTSINNAALLQTLSNASLSGSGSASAGGASNEVGQGAAARSGVNQGVNRQGYNQPRGDFNSGRSDSLSSPDDLKAAADMIGRSDFRREAPLAQTNGQGGVQRDVPLGQILDIRV